MRVYHCQVLPWSGLCIRRAGRMNIICVPSINNNNILFCHLQRRAHVRLHGHTKTRRRVAIQIVRSNAPYRGNGVHMPCAAVYSGAHAHCDPYTFAHYYYVISCGVRTMH